ncbi:MAG: hypothetical protein WCK65_02015 [Rhodospirillaceae bacterium]
MYDIDPDDEYRPPTKEEVLAQLDDWRQRLHKLYVDIISWLPVDQGYESEIRDVMIHEGQMRKADVPPQPVPELVVRRMNESVLTFTPKTCWIIGANGRVRLRTATTFHKLTHTDSQVIGPGWRLYRQDWPRPEFDKPIDRKLLVGIPVDRKAICELAGVHHG